MPIQKDQVSISPKLVALCKWEHIDELNEQLDNGVSPNALVSWIKDKGFNISLPMVYKYQALRNKAIQQKVAVESLVGIIQPEPMPMDTPSNIAQTRRLKSEISALDTIIQRGYDTLNQMADMPVQPRLMMDAIKLKNELTGGTHAFLTPYGLDEFRELEMGRCNALIEVLMQFIPADVQEQAVDAVTKAEDDYYQGTPYYRDYLSSQGLTDNEIEARMQAVVRRKPIVQE